MSRLDFSLDFPLPTSVSGFVRVWGGGGVLEGKGG